jgi:hypothetical protein
MRWYCMALRTQKFAVPTLPNSVRFSVIIEPAANNKRAEEMSQYVSSLIV